MTQPNRQPGRSRAARCDESDVQRLPIRTGPGEGRPAKRASIDQPLGGWAGCGQPAAADGCWTTAPIVNGRQLPKGVTMTNPLPVTGSQEAIGRCFMLLRHAALQLFEEEADGLDSGIQFTIASLHLEVLAYLTPGQAPPTISAPVSIADAIHKAAAESLWWDLTEMPELAVDTLIGLAELDHALQTATP